MKTIEEQEIQIPVESEVAENAEVAVETPAETPEHIHYSAICELTTEVQVALSQWQEAKDEASDLKKRYDRLTERLLTLISAGPERQRKLFTEPNEDGEATEQDCDAYRSHLVSELNLTKGLTEGLEGLGLTTLGELQDYWRAGKHLYDEKGWGQEKAGKVADAFADFGVEHPELFGKASSEEPAEEADTDTEEDSADDE